ncbi:hypothetical protein [Sulfurimonas sp.]|uniref:hypothetical protein n=1 Tax=Sulfurimonas sp. TaxID=2022749 RepID=UPI003565DF38
MSLEHDKKYKKLYNYIYKFKQSVALVEDDITTNLLDDLKKDLQSKTIFVYIDFKNIHSTRELATKLIEQYKLHIDNNIDIKLSSDDYTALDYILELFEQAETIHENITIWMDSFTNVLTMEEDWLFGLLRGHFQQNQYTVYIFTSDSKDKINSVFYDKENPFFRFARII